MLRIITLSLLVPVLLFLQPPAAKADGADKNANEFEIGPNATHSIQGVTIKNRDAERTLSVALTCSQGDENKEIKLEGSTQYFSFKVENVTKDCPAFEIEANFVDAPEDQDVSFDVVLPTGASRLTTEPSVFVFNPVSGNWAEAKGGGKPSEPGKAFATLTESYNKVVAGVISYPDVLSQGPAQLTPKTLVSAGESLDPTMGYLRIKPPQATSTGGTSVDLPLLLRPARGPAPAFRVGYVAGRGVGLLGQGWDLIVPEITVETVSAPFHATLETEDYMFNGQLLFPLEDKVFLAPNKRGGALKPRVTKMREYRMRDVSSGMIIRRHGDTPATYVWEVYDPQSGQTSLFGAQRIYNFEGLKTLSMDKSAVEIGGPHRSISRWMLTQVFDVQKAKNQTLYSYQDVCGETGQHFPLLKCRGQFHVPLLDTVIYNSVLDQRVKGISAGWQEGVTTVSFNYISRKSKRATTHGRFGAIIANRAWLDKIEVRYGPNGTHFFSGHEFTLGHQGNAALNFRHHLTKVMIKADPKLLPDPKKEASTGDTSVLGQQVFQFEYHQSESDGSKGWKAQPDLLATSTGWDKEIKRPRILKDILKNTPIEEIATPAALGTMITKENGGSLHIAVGAGTDVQSKLQTVGAKLSVTGAKTEGLTSFVDIDGDGLVDLVKIEGNAMQFCLGKRGKTSAAHDPAEKGFNAFKPDEILMLEISDDCGTVMKATSDGEPSTPMQAFSKASSDTFSLSPEAHLTEGNFAGLNLSTTQNRTTTYFADVDGDGLIDIVDGMQVFYNLGRHKDGDILFGLNQPLIPGVPASAAATPQAPPFGDAMKATLTAQQIALEDELAKFPEVRPVLVWRAQLAGFVAATGSITAPPGSTIQVVRDNRISAAVGGKESQVCGQIEGTGAKIDIGQVIHVADDRCDTFESGVSQARKLEKFGPLDEDDIVKQRIPGDAFMLRMQENDVMQIRVIGLKPTIENGKQVQPHVTTDVKLAYRLIDWDETFNATFANDLTSPFGDTFGQLADRAPATEFDVLDDVSLVSGFRQPVRVPAMVNGHRFAGQFVVEGAVPELELVVTNVETKAVTAFQLTDAGVCPQAGSTFICDFDLGTITDAIDLQVVVQNHPRRASSKLSWIAPPRALFVQPNAEDSRAAQNAALKNKYAAGDDKAAAAIALSDSLPKPMIARTEPTTIRLPVPVHDPRFARWPTRITHESTINGEQISLPDERFLNVRREARAEDRALDRLCDNFKAVVEELEARGVDNQNGQLDPEPQCENAGNNLPVIKVGESDEELLNYLLELRTPLAAPKSLYYDRAIVTALGHRLPVATDPSRDCGGDLCKFEFKLGMSRFATMANVNFRLRLRLFVDGKRIEFQNETGSTKEQFFDIGRGVLQTNPVFVFDALPGQLAYFELTALPKLGGSNLETLALAARNNVFGKAEVLLSNSASDSYENFHDDGEARLQLPVLVADAAHNQLKDMQGLGSAAFGVGSEDLEALKSLTNPDHERSPTFTFDKGAWGVSYRIAGNGDPVAAIKRQFPDLSGLQAHKDKSDLCSSAVDNFDLDPATSVPAAGANPGGADCDVPVELARAKVQKIIRFSSIEPQDGGAQAAPLIDKIPYDHWSNYKWKYGPVRDAAPMDDPRWTWAYAIEEPDLTAYSRFGAPALFRMNAGRLGPDLPLQDSIAEVKELLIALDSLGGSPTIVGTADGDDQRRRGRPQVSPDSLRPQLFAPVQTSTSRTISKSFSLLIASATLMKSERETEANYLDVNGDGFPEYIDGSGSGVMSSPVGVDRGYWLKAFLSDTGASPAPAPRASGFEQNGTALSATLGAGVAPPTAGQFLTRMVNRLMSGTVEGNFSLSANASLGGGYNDKNIAFADFNGDGLIDPYTEKKFNDDLGVRLNAGGKAVAAPNAFHLMGDPNPDGNPTLFERFGTSTTAGLGVNLGFQRDNNSFSAGIGTGFNASGGYFAVMDFTADGLADLVYPVEGGVVVVVNLGNGFDAAHAKFHSLPGLGGIEGFTFNQTAATETVHTDIGGTITGGVTAFGLKATFTPGIKNAESYARSLVQIRDFNADGVPDVAEEKSVYRGLAPSSSQIPSEIRDFMTGLPKLGTGDGKVVVHYNPEGRVGLLKSVTQTTGSLFRLDYALTGNSGPEHGRNVWALTRVETQDTYNPSNAVVANANQAPADGDEIAGQHYRYEAGHFNRAERAFYGFSRLKRDDYGVDCADLSSCPQAGAYRALRVTQSHHDTQSYFGKGALVAEYLFDPSKWRSPTMRQAISAREMAYDVYDFSKQSADIWHTSQTTAPLQVRGENGTALDDAPLLDHLRTADAEPTSRVAVAAVFAESKTRAKALEHHEYTNAFESYLGTNRSRLTGLSVFGEETVVAKGALPPSIGLMSAFGSDPDQWGQPVVAYDIGQVTDDESTQADADLRSLRVEMAYAQIDSREAPPNDEAEEFTQTDAAAGAVLASQPAKQMHPLLGRPENLRITHGLEPRVSQSAENEFLRTRQAIYEPLTGNLREICLLGSDVRPGLCREYADALDKTTDSDPLKRVEQAHASVAIREGKLIHTRITGYDAFGNVTSTLSPVNQRGEWLARSFRYDGDPFRMTPTRTAVTRCLLPGAGGASTPEAGAAPVCRYRADPTQGRPDQRFAVRHRSLAKIDAHFGSVAISQDINNVMLMTNRDAWGRPALVARSFGEANAASRDLKGQIDAASKRFDVKREGFWTPVLSFQYVGPREPIAGQGLYRAMQLKHVGGNFYRGLEARARTQGAIASYTLSDGAGKVIQSVRESEVCRGPALPLDKPKPEEPLAKAAVQQPKILGQGFNQFDYNAFEFDPAPGALDIPTDNFTSSAPNLTATAPTGAIVPFVPAFVPDDQADFVIAARQPDLCADFDKFIVQPGPAQDALGRTVAQYEAFSSSENPGAPIVAESSAKTPFKLTIRKAGEGQKISLVPVQSTLFDAADRPLLSISRLGRIATQGSVDEAALPLTKARIKAGGEPLEATQFAYAVEQSSLDGQVFATLTMDPRCALSRTTFDARGLALRVSQRHDTAVNMPKTAQAEALQDTSPGVRQLMMNLQLDDPKTAMARTMIAKAPEADVMVDLKLALETGDEKELDFDPSLTALTTRDGVGKKGYDLTACKPVVQTDGEPPFPLSQSDAAPQAVSYRYDALRQLTAVHLPSPGPTALAPDEQQTASLGTIKIRYDGFGRRISLDDVNTGKSKISYDTLNNVVEESKTGISDGTETKKVYTYAADRLTQISYDSGPNLTKMEDAADRVTLAYGSWPMEIVASLANEDTQDWFKATLNAGSCTHCVGQVTAVRDRSGLRAYAYTALGQPAREVRSILHPDIENPREIGRFTQRNRYTSFGDLVATDLDDLRPAAPSPNCLRNGTYVCGGTVSLGYRHTPDGQLAAVTFADGNQPIQQVAYDALSRPYLTLAGDLTRTHLHFDGIDQRLNRTHTRTAVGMEVQNVTFGYQPGGTLNAYSNEVAAYGTELDPYTADFEFGYDTPNRLVGMLATVTGAEGGADSLGAEAVYAYDDAHRFTARRFDTGGFRRSWLYTYPDRTSAQPQHAPLTVSYGAGPEDDIGEALPRIDATSYDDLGRLAALRNREPGLGDPEATALTPRLLKWDAEDRLRHVTVRLPANGTQDVNPTGVRDYDTLPEVCGKNSADSTATRLRCSVEDQYTYDHGSNRVVRRSVWPRKPLVGETDQEPVTERMTLYVTPFYARGYGDRGTVQISQGGRTVASIDMPYSDAAATPGVTYLYSDMAVGSVSASVRTRGEPGIDRPVIARREYSPYGLAITGDTLAELQAAGEGQKSLYSFHGKELDASTGFSSFGARYYSRDLGVWLSADPILHSYISGSPNGGVFKVENLSPYLYSFGSPTRAFDPNGEFVVTTAVLVGGGAAVVALAAKVYGDHYAKSDVSKQVALGISDISQSVATGIAAAGAGATGNLGASAYAGKTAASSFSIGVARLADAMSGGKNIDELNKASNYVTPLGQAFAIGSALTGGTQSEVDSAAATGATIESFVSATKGKFDTLKSTKDATTLKEIAVPLIELSTGTVDQVQATKDLSEKLLD